MTALLHVAVALVLLVGASALARTPPIVLDPREGVWIGGGELFVRQARDQWSVFPAPGTVNELAADNTIIWIASDEGAIRLDTGSRKSTVLGMDQGLPSQIVAAVAVDEQFVWLATNKGLARYRKLDRSIQVYREQEGLPHRSMNDALTLGRQVWFGTRAGIAVYDPATDGLRAFTRDDGLGGDDVAELYQVGDDLWCRTDEGVSRFRVRTRVFTNFPFKELGGTEIHAFVQDGERIWIGTDRGLVSIETSSDAVVPFPQQGALKGKAVVGVEVFGDYLFIVSDQEVVQYHKQTRAIRRFTQAEGLLRQDGALGTLLAGGLFTMVYADGAWVYDIQRDLWSFKELKATATASEEGSALRLFGRLNLLQSHDFETGTWSPERYATAEAGFGLALRFDRGRSFNASLRLDYGQLEPLVGQCINCPEYQFRYRDLEYRVEYLGGEGDAVRQVVASDKFQYRTVEEGLERPLLLQGGEVRLAESTKETGAKLTVTGGRRRGATVRDFLTGPRQEIYQLSKRYVLPGTERVYVDGELLTNGTDYTVIYPSGQLAFLDPERVDELSIIEVEYEHDLVPKKGLGTLSLLDMLPADREIGDWSRSGQARLISEETGLYQQIDGAAPKYIDRGWVRSVYSEYRQGSRSIQVAIHDMGADANAESLYNYDLPPAREPVPLEEVEAELILDVGLATAYAAKAHAKSLYIELTIDEKSDAAKASLKLFAIQILTRGTSAGALAGTDVHEWLVSARAAAIPTRGLEVGVRATELWGVGPEESSPRRLLRGVMDARLERGVGERGRLTAYGELAGTRSQTGLHREGWAGMGFLRLSHPLLEGSFSGRRHGVGYQTLGTDTTLFATDEQVARLRDEVRFQATGYPRRWLPTTAFFLRQASRIDDGTVGIVQQALTRVQLTREGLPATSLQVGHTLVDGLGRSHNRIKAVGQVDYDLAQGILKFTGIRRFAVRGLYGISEAGTDELGQFAEGQRVQLLRLEGKLAPNATESAYALFRQRRSWLQAEEGTNFGLQASHWELNSGARSAFIPGLIPQVNYTVIYDDDRMTTAESVRASKGAMAGALGIYPGQWWAALTPVVIEPRYSVADDQQAAGELRTLAHRTHRVDNRAIYAGAGKVAVDLYQLYEQSHTGEDQHRDGWRLELRNRVIYRPRFHSPITFRVNVATLRLLNDQTVLASAPEWGRQHLYEGVVEWLMRWSRVYTTKLKGTYALGQTADMLFVDTEGTAAAAVQTFSQHRVGPEVELRIFPLEEASRLYLLQRAGVFRLFASGEGALESWEFYVAGGAIWTLGDSLYLDGEVVFRKMTCLAQPCTPAAPVELRLFLTFNL